MQLFILTNADGSPVADKSEAAVVSMTDHTKLQDAGELVLGDNEAIDLKFTTATGSAPAFAGGATYVPAITLGTLTTDGSGNYAGATGFASITGGWSARIALTSTALISAINILGSGYGNPRGGWLTLQVQVTDPSGYVQTYALIKVFVEWRVLASTSLEPLTPVEEVLANSANVAALRTALSLSGTNTGDQTIALSGDISGTGTAGIATTLATVNANVGSFGSATAAPVITVNAKGLVTAASSATITPAVGSVTGLGTGVAALLAGAASGTGGPAGTTSPAFTTPNIGAATGTSLALTSTTDSSTTDGTTGSIRTLGGLSIAKSVRFGGQYVQSDTATVSGLNRVLLNSVANYTTSDFAQSLIGLNVEITGGGSEIIPTLKGASFNAEANFTTAADEVYGIIGSASLNCPGAARLFALRYVVNINGTGGTIPLASLCDLAYSRSGTTATTDFYGFAFRDGLGSGVATNAYGLYLGDINASSLAYAIYTGAGRVRFGDVPVHADNAAAVTAGLAVGVLYRTGDALKIVHI